MPHEFCLCLLLNPTLNFFSVPLKNITVLVYPSENVKEVENITVTCSTYTLRDGPEKKPFRRNYSAVSEWKFYALQCQQKLYTHICPSYFQ